MIRPELQKKIDQAIKLLRQIPLADGECVEVWKDISGYEDKYQVSNCGNVRSLEYHNAKGLKRTKNLKPATDCKGYLRCALSKNNILRTFKVHRLVAMAFLENPNNLPQVNHKDGNHCNNCVDNLEWVTQKENNIHSYRVLNRTSPMKGKMPPNRKIKEEDIRTFYELNQQGMAADRIGIIYGVCGSTIRKHIRKYKAQCSRGEHGKGIVCSFVRRVE